LSKSSYSEKTAYAKENGYKTIAVHFEPHSIDFHVTKNTKGISEIDIKNFVKSFKITSEDFDYNIVSNNSDYDSTFEGSISQLINILDGTNTNTPSKATNAQADIRRATVFEMLTKGSSRGYIVQYAAKTWQVNARQCDEYISQATAQIKDLYGEEYKTNLIEKHLAKLNDLYMKSYTIEDFRECRNLIETEAKLLGLFAPIKTQSESKLTHNVSILSLDPLDDSKDNGTFKNS
jgi:hypothetical protein